MICVRFWAFDKQFLSSHGYERDVVKLESLRGYCELQTIEVWSNTLNGGLARTAQCLR